MDDKLQWNQSRLLLMIVHETTSFHHLLRTSSSGSGYYWPKVLGKIYGHSSFYQENFLDESCTQSNLVKPPRERSTILLSLDWNFNI